jgi:hypothetical protein
MVASPWPLVLLRDIHESFELADHAHSRSVLSAKLPFPPEAGTSGGVLVIDTAHRLAVGALTLVVADPPQPLTTATMRRGQSCRANGIRSPNMFVCAVSTAHDCKLNDVNRFGAGVRG